MANKNVTIFIANPKTTSFSHALADAYREGAAQAGHVVTVVDLYDPKNHLGYLKSESSLEYKANQPVRERLQECIYDANEIVFIHPLWWGGPPAILKNMIDQVFTPGFAYKRVKRRLPKAFDIMPQRLLRGRNVKLFITCDGQRWTNMLRLFPYLIVWRFYIFSYTGLRLKTFRLFNGMRHRSSFWRNKQLAEVNRMAAKR